MQIVEMLTGDDVTLHCPKCGTKSMTDKGEITACEHLLYVSSSETPHDPWYKDESVSLPNDDESLDKHEVALLGEVYPGNQTLLFLMAAPAPSGMELYVVYDIADRSLSDAYLDDGGRRG